MHRILIILLLFTGIRVDAREYQLDTLALDFVDTVKIDSLRSMADYAYVVEESEKLGWFGRQWLELKRAIGRTLGVSAGTASAIIGGALPFLAICFLIYHFSRTQGIHFFAKKNRYLGAEIEELESIESEEDLDTKLSDFIRDKNWRGAVRILYLKSLWLLHKKSWIELENYKTNYDYKQELQKTSRGQGFDKLVLFFEKICYGKHEINENQFYVIKDDFETFFTDLKRHSS